MNEVVGKKQLFALGAILIAAAIGSFIGGWSSGTTDKELKNVAEKLVESTDKLSGSVSQIIPLIDTVDDNVKTMSSKFDKISNFTVPDYSAILTAVGDLEKKVNSVETKVDIVDVKVTKGTDKLAAKIDDVGSKVVKGTESVISRINNIDPKMFGITATDFDVNKSRRILCMNRGRRTKCIPRVTVAEPLVMAGHIRECLLYEDKLHCKDKPTKLY